MTSPPDDVLDLLAAYALGALEPEEVARVSALLEEQPELRSTLAELRATADRLPYALPEVSPPPELRQRVLAYAIDRAAPQPRGPITRPVGRTRAWFLALGGLAAAAIVAAILGWARLGGTQAELARARSELATAQAVRQQVAQVILQPDALARLAGSGSGTLVRGADGSLVLVAQLPPLPPGRVYQLWLIQGANSPVSGGTFTVDQQGRGLLALPPNRQALVSDVVAVTDEPDPGSPLPTTRPLISGTFPSA